MDMKNPHVIWASVAIVFLLVVPASLLVAFDKDVTAILTLAGLVAIPVLSAFGVAVYHKLDQVKEAGNGTLTTVLAMQQKTQDQLTALAMAMTPVSNPPREEDKSDSELSSTILFRPSGPMGFRLLHESVDDTAARL